LGGFLVPKTPRNIPSPAPPGSSERHVRRLRSTERPVRTIKGRKHGGLTTPSGTE